jgi:predicted  nucleic acid-binding Zn-ribbon protein
MLFECQNCGEIHDVEGAGELDLCVRCGAGHFRSPPTVTLAIREVARTHAALDQQAQDAGLPWPTTGLKVVEKQHWLRAFLGDYILDSEGKPVVVQDTARFKGWRPVVATRTKADGRTMRVRGTQRP